jgi:DEAD/DEAH box helicase domain-containing protein
MALQAITACPCNQDPDKDGCYRCVYQYRLGRNMELVSRDNARAVLAELVGSLGQLERVKTISDIYINPNFDSVLEARFIESLKRLGGVGSVPLTKLVQDVVHGKSGYVLEVGSQRYKIEPQRDIGPDDGVAVASKPDFVIWPWAASSNRRPIAVFCDGWAFHKDSLGADALKRSALVTSGKFWVWSVTHNDVATALKGDLNTDLESPLVTMSRHNGSIAPPGVPRAQEQAFTHHAVARLLAWLATPVDGEAIDKAVRQLQRNALWLGFLMVPHNPQERSACEETLSQWKHRLPDHALVSGKEFAPSVAKPGGRCLYFGAWPLDVAKAGGDVADHWSAPGALVLDDAAAESEEELHLAWRQWLHVFNTSQTLPGLWLVTSLGLDEGAFHALSGALQAQPTTPARPDGLGAAWDAVLKQTLVPLQDGLRALAKAGAELPEAGLELADPNGKVLADAELCWVARKLAVLRDDQADLLDAWVSQDWTAMVLDEALSKIAGTDWAGAVAQHLGLSPMNKD